MMNRLFLFIMFSLFSWAGYAQENMDSVRVTFTTSQGAEIGVDGDISSTNMLKKWVKYGQHTITVTYGSSYSKDSVINVIPGGTTNFEILVSGSISATSTPSGGELYVDGIRYGKLPQTINLIGRHNFRVEGNKDLYYPYNETIEIAPDQMLERDFPLVKRPMKLYGFVVANYMIQTNALGVMGGLGRRFGGYLKVNIGLNGPATGGDWLIHTYNEIITNDRYKNKHKYWGVNGGLMVHAIPCLFVYVGSGYGSYSHGVLDGYSNVYKVSGAEIDFGAMFKFKALLVQAGYTRILAKSKSGGSWGAFNIGVGITIHKEKKR